MHTLVFSGAILAFFVALLRGAVGRHTTTEAHRTHMLHIPLDPLGGARWYMCKLVRVTIFWYRISVKSTVIQRVFATIREFTYPSARITP
jgi:hypothetical protein